MARKKSAKKKTYTKAEIAGLKARALTLWRADNSHAMELGKALLAVRAALRKQHGAFKEWWQDNRLVQSRVSYCMDLAKGTLGKRKTKAKSAEYKHAAKATHLVSKRLNELFVSCARATDATAVHSLPKLFKDAVGATLFQAAELAGWKLDTPEVKQVADDYTRALERLISTVSSSGPAAKKAAASASAL